VDATQPNLTLFIFAGAGLHAALRALTAAADIVVARLSARGRGGGGRGPRRVVTSAALVPLTLAAAVALVGGCMRCAFGRYF
jgi:hypothetical protein